jgi:acetylornithine deacetylase/succinyl-diaminopimelate desuccinylase-like protein|tara:strand:+ start:498 stop:1859 length:1362 start_codon:yes stop_codon:yes gene_type:complete
MNSDKALKFIDKNKDSLLKDLQTLIHQPSISAKNEGIEECSILVSKILKKSGINSEILRLGNNAAPLVYGEVKSKNNPNTTLLFYNHYDVQPIDPLDLWDDPPFSGKIIGNKIFGRGASDDKGELITRVKAVESYLKTCGDVPCNIKFVIEGEEENGSENIVRYLKKYKKKFACDGVVWEFGYVDQKNRPIIGLGMKGLLYVELTAKESVRDVHSSFAVIIKNPAWKLVQALNTMRDENGKILIKGWHDDIKPLSKNDIRLIKKEPFDADGFKKEYGVKNFVGGKNSFDAKKSLVSGVTCNIAGMESGYIGAGAKTVLPGSAKVKIDFRLVPNMDPKKLIKLLQKHLRVNGFSDITINVLNAESAARTNPNEKIVSTVCKSTKTIFGDYILNISNAGTGPMHAFRNILSVPCISVGASYIFCRMHSPNEFAKIDLLHKTSKNICLLMENFSRS